MSRPADSGCSLDSPRLFCSTSRYIHADRDYFTIESGFHLSSVHFSSRNPLIYHAPRTPSRTTAFRFTRYPSTPWSDSASRIYSGNQQVSLVRDPNHAAPILRCVLLGSRAGVLVAFVNRRLSVQSGSPAPYIARAHFNSVSLPTEQGAVPR